VADVNAAGARDDGALLAAAGRHAVDRVRREIARLTEVFDDERVADIRIRPSRRMSASLARAYPQRGEIAVAVPVFSSKHLEEVLAHEVAHLVCWWRHGRTRPHGAEWRAIMAEAGHEPRVRLLADDVKLKPRRRRKVRHAPIRRRLYSFVRDLL
jgi:hypothetical protein